MYIILSPEVRQVSLWYPPYISISTLFLIFCLYGLWNMRRWSAWGLGAYFIVHASVSWALKLWTVNSWALALGLLLVAIFYYRRMKP
jgi:hypothetical protein